MKNPHLLRAIGLGAASAFLLWIGWPPFVLNLLLLVAFVPLLMVHDIYRQGLINRRAFLLISYFTFLVWNLSTTYWVWNASKPGSVAAFTLNALLMQGAWVLFDKAHGMFGERKGLIALVCFWIGMEYLHLNWELTWPWLVLGNGFACNPQLVQWYEFTGHLGGSLWIWVINILVFKVIHSPFNKMALLRIALWIFIPAAFSFFLLKKELQPSRNAEVVIVQPNIDPYREKFGSATPLEQLDRMLTLAEPLLDNQTKFLVFPETALVGGLVEQELQNNALINAIRAFLSQYPQLKLISGADSYALYNTEKRPTATAHKMEDGGWFDAFNTALAIDTGYEIGIYHKSRLVPGVERMPYPGLFGFLEKFSIDLGGTSGSLGTQDETEVFTHDGISVAPVICYESVFGEFTGSYIRKGAHAIFIITNDGWWGNTSGYRQHWHYARLRAIETRREIARSANTGISGHIDARGNQLQKTEWWVPAAIKVSLQLYDVQTFYVKNGDSIGKISAFAAVLIILTMLVRPIVERGKKG